MWLAVGAFLTLCHTTTLMWHVDPPVDPKGDGELCILVPWRPQKAGSELFFCGIESMSSSDCKLHRADCEVGIVARRSVIAYSTMGSWLDGRIRRARSAFAWDTQGLVSWFVMAAPNNLQWRRTAPHQYCVIAPFLLLLSWIGNYPKSKIVHTIKNFQISS